MIVIVSDDGKSISFSHNGIELSRREGFRRLGERYSGEPQEVKRKIDELRERFYRTQKATSFLFVVRWMRAVDNVRALAELIDARG